MKITSFDPMILTAHPEETVALFEALGFERRHTKRDFGVNKTTFIRMGLGEFRVNIVDAPPLEQDRVYVHINVDDFQEGYDFLVSKGFRSAIGDELSSDASSVGTSLISPSGFTITLGQHIRK